MALACGFLVFLADLLSKYFTQRELPLRYYLADYPYGGIGVFKSFFGIELSLVHATNRGAAWGILAEYQDWLLFFRIFLVGALIVYLFTSKKVAPTRIPISLIVAGASGNILDYFLYGHVVDMIHLNFWGYDYPVFNIADSAIFIGVFWLIIASYTKRKY